MTKLQMTDIEVCSFCREAHERRSKNSNFNKLKKEKVQVCFICKEPMCSDCVQDSQLELQGTLLAKFGFDICYACVTTFRRDHAVKPKLEKFAYKAISAVRDNLQVELCKLKETAGLL